MSKRNSYSLIVNEISKIFHLFPDSKAYLKFFLEIFFPSLQKEQIKYYQALNGITFNLKRGESLGIIGLNGAGKSTLLQILSGVIKPSSGQIKVSGKIAALLELGNGFNPDFTGKENVYLNASLFGLNKEEIDSRYESILEFSEIYEFIDQPIKTYSSGMILRLAFSVIAHVDADILIIDEALAVGDFKFTQKCMNFISEFKTQGTLILVTHDHLTVQNICEKCLWLEKGEVKAFGHSKTITDEYVSHILCKEDISNAYKPSTGSNFKSNDKEISEFGKGGACITSLKFVNCKTEKMISILSGNEKVSLSVEVSFFKNIESPVVGFIVRNRNGQDLFSDNTLSSPKNNILVGNAGEIISVGFEFIMPTLKKGKYSLSVAISVLEGEDFVPLHWINDAIFFESFNDSFFKGLVGIPMNRITFSKIGLNNYANQRS